MTPVNGSLKPCRTAGSGGGGTSSSTSSSNHNTGSGEKNIDKNDTNDSSNGDGIHGGGRPAQRAVLPALPLRYVQQTATQPAHYVFPRPAISATQPGTEVVKEGGKEREKQKHKEKKRGKEREKKPKEKEKEMQKEMQKEKEVNGAQKASKTKTSRSRVPRSPTTATAAAHASHAAATPAAPIATEQDACSQSAEAALPNLKPSPQAMNGLEHAGNQAQGHSVQGPAPVRPAESTSPMGDATLHHSRESSATETSAQSGGSAAHTHEPQHFQDSIPSEITSRDHQGLRPPEDSLAQRQAATLASPQPPAPVSPTQYQPIHPSFRHAPPDQPMGIVTNGDLPHTSQPPLPTGPRMHQAHPSNASGLYGPFHGSQSSSPAPPFVGGLPPPPGMPIPNGRAPHMMHPNGPGFPPMMPFGTDMIPGSGFDNFPRPAAMPCGGPMDLRPHGSALGHSAPHSFHGSQSSVHPEENGMYPQYPPGLRNGAAGPGEDQRGAMGQNIGSLDYGRMGPNPGAPFRDVAAGDHVDALVAHIQRHFSSPELADCCLELRYADDRAPPMRIPGHRLVFSRSLRLAGLVRKQAFQTGPADGAPQTLLLETQSSWVRSDSFYMALQYLYGLPLLQPPSWRDNVNGSEVTSAGSSAIEQFEFAISYAAAGHLLVDNRILARGCEIAAQVLTWQTVELALAFALEKYTDKGSYEAYKYGDGSRVLLNAVVTFIIQHFPPNFSLNADSRELVPFARFPVGLLPSPPTSDAAAQSPHLSSPSEASVHMSRNHKARKLSNIQFGDLPCAEEDETPKPPSPAQPASYSTLSRILLDIPFPQLKMILESPGTGNVHAWANAEARYKIIKSAVDERETRRRRALEAILAGRVPDAGKIREGLRRPEPQDLGPWTAVGWQEDVLPYGNANGPSLGRRWAPIMEPPTGLTSVYP